MACIDINIADYIDEIDTDDLLIELRGRNVCVVPGIPLSCQRNTIIEISNELKLGRVGHALGMLSDLAEDLLQSERSIARSMQSSLTNKGRLAHV